jgi:hypothetical protein
MADEFDPTTWITTNEASDLTGYSPVMLRQFARESKIKGCKRGRDWFLDKADMLAYTERMDELGAAKHDPWRSGGRERDEG